MSDTPVVIDVQEVTQLSKIVACNNDYYKATDRDKSDDAYTLFIVNDGATNGETPVVDFYYGLNKLSQMIITKTLPYPGVDQKVYIKTTEATRDGDQPKGIYLYQSSIGGYLCLTNLAESGFISTEAQNIISGKVYDLIAQNYLRPTWKTIV